MNEFLRNIGITKIGHYGENNSYVIDLDNDTEWGKYYSLLEKNSELEQLDENSFLTDNNSSLIYQTDKYQLNLLADFDENTYKLVVNEI